MPKSVGWGFGSILLLLWLSGCTTPPPQQETLLRADRVVVDKSERRLRLLYRGKVVREYPIALGDAPIGHKVQEGDERTPEGHYVLDWRNPNSRFYKSIHISYPNAQDRARAKALGVNPGGMIMIHGRPNYIHSKRVLAEYDRRDWTDGCIAVNNEQMDEIWNAVPDGTPIDIFP